MNRLCRTTRSRQHLHVVSTAVAVLASIPADGAFTIMSNIAWDGSCGSNSWHATCGPGLSMTNWNRDGMPAITDTVSIPVGAPSPVLLSQPGFASEITCDTGLRISNTTLQLGAGGGFIVGLDMDSTFSTIQFMTPGAELNLQNTATWTVGTITGDGTVINLGTLNPAIFASAMTMTLQNGAEFRNEAGASATLRFVQINANCEVRNDAGATFTLRGDNVGGYLKGAGVFTNAGDFKTDYVTSSSREIGAFFNQTGGQFIVQGAPNSLNTYFTNAGNFSGGTMIVNDDCNLRFQHPGGELLPYVFDGLESISGIGNLYVEIPVGAPATADWQVAAPLDVNMSGTAGFVINSTRLSLGDALTNLGRAQWQGGLIRNTVCGTCVPRFINASDDFTINSASGGVALAARFQNHGKIDHTLGHLVINTDGSMVNAAEYNWIRGNIQRGAGATNGYFANFGTVRKPNLAATQDGTISSGFLIEDPGELIIEKSTVTLSNSVDAEFLMSGGRMQIDSGATARLTGGVLQAIAQVESTIEGLGRFAVELPASTGEFTSANGATMKLNMAGASPNGFHFASGRIGGPGVIRNTGNFYWTGGTMGIDHDPLFDLDFRNEGAMLISGGTMGADKTFLENMSGGVVTQTGSISMIQTPGTSIDLPSITNSGEWNVTPGVGSSTIAIGAQGRLQNNASGVLSVNAVVPNGTLNVTSWFRNIGLVAIGPTSRMNLMGYVEGLSNGVLSGGSWFVQPGGQLTFNGTQVHAVGSGTTVAGSGASLPDVKPTENHGELTANDDWTLTLPLSLMMNTGKLEVAAGTMTCGAVINEGGTVKSNGGALQTSGEINNGGTSVFSFCDHQSVVGLAGSTVGGFICGSFNNNSMGVVRPGGPDAPGPFSVTGNLNLSDGGYLDVELGGTIPVDDYDRVIVDGNVALDGILRVRALPGFAPTPGQQFTIITASNGTISGTFDQVTGYGQYSVAYAPNAVTLTVVTPPVPGDINGDGLVNVTDLLAVIMGWGACPAPPAFCPADLNGDGLVNVTDLLAVIGNWG